MDQKVGESGVSRNYLKAIRTMTGSTELLLHSNLVMDKDKQDIRQYKVTTF